MDNPTTNILSICSGVGGLDLGVGLALGGSSRTVCYVEREVFAACILAARMADQTLDEAPVWSDLHTFDGKPWRGVVDCVIGGYPCQPFSLAGRRGGERDPRHLWPSIARILGEIEPGIVFFENVPGHLSLGFRTVRDDLQAMGYRVAAGLFSAEEVGAPHKRERLFILGIRDVAHDPAGGCGELRPAPRRDGRTEQNGGGVANPEQPYLHQASAGRPNGTIGTATTGSGGGVADSARYGGDGSQWQGWSGRGVCEDGGGLANAQSRNGTVYEGRFYEGEGASNADWAGRGLDDPSYSDGWCGVGGAEKRTRSPRFGRRGLAGSGSELDDPECAGRGQVEQPPAGSREAGEPLGVRAQLENVGLADTGGQRPQGACEAGPAAGAVGRGDGAGVFRPFPPGPSDREAWRDILVYDSDLAPAVTRTAESEVRRMADGLASRLDRLRACGNGVVPLAAAYAFVSLWACLREEHVMDSVDRIPAVPGGGVE